MVMGLAYFSIATASFLIFGLGSYLFPGSNMIILVSVIGLLFDLPVLIAYGMFSTVMPRSGGDYVYISRTFLPPIGFAATFVFWLYGLTFAGGQNAYFTVSFGLSPYLGAIRATSGIPSLVTLSQTLMQPVPLVAVGTVMLLVLFVFMLIPTTVTPQDTLLVVHRGLRRLSPPLRRYAGLRLARPVRDGLQQPCRLARHQHII